MKSERQLLDEIRLREASLADARREHAAGELSDEDAAAIARREESALARARELLEEARTVTTATTTPRTARRRRRGLLALALACFVLAAGVLVWSNLGLRQAGQSATGGLSLSQSQKVQQLGAEAEADLAAGAALSAYQQVLAIQPTNVVALTEAGWLDFSAGSSSHQAALVARGVGLLTEAVRLAPRSPAPRLYYAIVADSTPGDRALATKQFKLFLSLHPSKAQLAIAAKFLHALGLRGRGLRAALARTEFLRRFIARGAAMEAVGRAQAPPTATGREATLRSRL